MYNLAISLHQENECSESYKWMLQKKKKKSEGNNNMWWKDEKDVISDRVVEKDNFENNIWVETWIMWRKSFCSI